VAIQNVYLRKEYLSFHYKSLYNPNPKNLMAKKIVVYGAPSCPWCVKLKDWLEGNKVTFEYVDLSLAENQHRGQELIEKSGQMGIPVTIIDDEVIIGFDKEKIAKLAEVK
jgi:glutaredoxin 3